MAEQSMIGVETALAPSETAPGLWPDWSELEQRIARTAYDTAHSRALASLIIEIQLQAALVDSAGALWQLHDYLSIQRHRIEGRFDFRPQPILFLFASLVKDKLLDLAELEGLADAKLAKIRAMAQF
jgi:hypothetical protein